MSEALNALLSWIGVENVADVADGVLIAKFLIDVNFVFSSFSRLLSKTYLNFSFFFFFFFSHSLTYLSSL
jgi:hypothetical protein